MNISMMLKNFSLQYKKSFVSARDIGRLYDDLAKTHSSALSRPFQNRVSTALPYLELPSKAKILDIGCGDGLFAGAFPEDSHYQGIDVSRRMIEKAIGDHKKNPRNTYFEKIDAQDFVKYCQPMSYDVILMAFSQKYFPENFFSSLFPLLKKDGKLLLIDFQADSDNLLEQYFEEFKNRHASSLVQLPTIRPYAPEALAESALLQTHGFRQTIFFTSQITSIENQYEYLVHSGILPEKLLVFGQRYPELTKEFVAFLKAKQYRLPPQKAYICIAKK